MRIFNVTAALLASGLAISAVGQPARAGQLTPVKSEAAAADAMAKAPKNDSESLMVILGPVLADTVKHDPTGSCNSQIYSQHDVVGDSNACFMQRLDAPVGATE